VEQARYEPRMRIRNTMPSILRIVSFLELLSVAGTNDLWKWRVLRGADLKSEIAAA
jgi:hypothetical protein